MFVTYTRTDITVHKLQEATESSFFYALSLLNLNTDRIILVCSWTHAYTKELT
jgi:hypothetical protein